MLPLPRRSGSSAGSGTTGGGTSDDGGPGAGAAIALILLAVVPAGLSAQDWSPQAWGPAPGTVAFEVRGGASVPLSSNSFGAVTEPGASVGGGVSVHLRRHLSLTANGDYHLLKGNEEDAGALVPDMRVLSATGGVEVHFVEPNNRWTGALSLGAGVSRVETDEALSDGTPATILFEATALTFRGGMKVGYQATSSVDVYLEPSVYVITWDEELTEPYVIVAPGVDETFSVNWLVPLQAGVRIRL